MFRHRIGRRGTDYVYMSVGIQNNVDKFIQTVNIDIIFKILEQGRNILIKFGNNLFRGNLFFYLNA